MTDVETPYAAPRKKIFTLVALVAILLLAVAVRYLPSAPDVFTPDGVVFHDPDSNYHLRRVLYCVEHFPFTPSRDAYINYPYGYLPGWPPLSDQLTALFALLAGGSASRPDVVDAVAATMPVALGALTCVPVFLLGRRLAGSTLGGLISATVFAVLPAHVMRTSVGNADHDSLAMLLLVCYLLSLIWALDTSRVSPRGEGRPSVRSAVTMAAPVVLPGAIGALAFYTWLGAAVFPVAVVLACFAELLLNGGDPAGRRAVTLAGAGSLLVTAILLLPPALETNAIKFSTLSWFQPIALFTAAGVTGFAVWLRAVSIKKGASKLYYPVVCTALAASVIAVLLASVPAFRDAISASLQYVSGANPQLGSIVEYQPLFFESGTFTPRYALLLLSISIFTSIAGLMACAYRSFRGRRRQAMAMLALWSCFFLALAFLQRRFTLLFAPEAAFLTGLLCMEVGSFVARLRTGGERLRFYSRERKAKNTSKWSAPAAGGYGNEAYIVALSIALLACILPLTASSCELPLTEEYGAEWHLAMRWMANSTPPTSGYFGNGTPEFGVACWWDEGNYVTYPGMRPTVACGFQSGMKWVSQLFLETAENDATASMEQRGVRFLVMDYRLGYLLSDMTENAGKEYVDYFTTVVVLEDGRLVQYTVYSPLYYNSTFVRLQAYNGSTFTTAWGNVRAMEHFRVAYRGSGLYAVTVFELVKGAGVMGQTSPEGEVNVTVRVSGPEGRGFDYMQRVIADPDGRFELTLPYAQVGCPYPWHAVSDYVISTPTGTVTLSLLESQVVGGNVVRIVV